MPRRIKRDSEVVRMPAENRVFHISMGTLSDEKVDYKKASPDGDWEWSQEKS